MFAPTHGYILSTQTSVTSFSGSYIYYLTLYLLSTVQRQHGHDGGDLAGGAAALRGPGRGRQPGRYPGQVKYLGRVLLIPHLHTEL